MVHPAYRNRLSDGTLALVAQRLEAPDAILLQAGRNRTVRLTLPGTDGEPIDVAVKRFGRHTLWKDLLAARRGSKAWRAFQAATHLHGHGLGTPEPVAILERWEGSRLAASFLLTRYVADLRSFRRELVDLYGRHGPCEALMALLECVAVAVAEMHDAGFFHGDLGNQNLMLMPPSPADGRRRVLAIDLNRARCHSRPLTLRERARDLSRIHLPSDFLRVFKEMYWRGAVPPVAFQRWEGHYRKRYALHAETRRLRHPFRQRSGPSPDGDYPADRDVWIWDERSVQAIPAFRSRDRHRLRPGGRVRLTLAAVLRGAWPVWRAYRTLRREAFRQPVAEVGGRVAVALTARPETLDREVALLRELGARNVLLRLYHHEDAVRRAFTLEAVRRLHAEGFGVALALVQDRRAVLDPVAWEAFGRDALRSVGSAVRWVEVGHAVNRVKWGVWSYAELAVLHAPVRAWARDFPGVRLVGPAAIDFEPDFLMAALRRIPEGGAYAGLSHHVYVDRRGPPEARQGGFDAVGKLALLRAVGRASGRCGDRLVVSEFNWPLRGTGVWSPVGSPHVSPGERTNDPSVDEAEAALYLVRYLLLGLCSGMADEMVFWRLAAHGFGLVDVPPDGGGEWRRRPGFEALRTWFRFLNGATFLAAEEQAGAWRLRFRRVDGTSLCVAWRGPEAWGHGACPPEWVPGGMAVDGFGRGLSPSDLPAAWDRGMPVFLVETQPGRPADGACVP